MFLLELRPGHYIDLFLSRHYIDPYFSLFRPIRVTIVENFRTVRGLSLNSSVFPGNPFKIHWDGFYFPVATRNRKWDLCTEVGGGKLGDGIDIY